MPSAQSKSISPPGQSLRSASSSKLGPPDSPKREMGMREWYAASVIGIAAFIGGLILWPGTQSQRVTVAVVQLDTGESSTIPPEAIKSTMARIQSTCCDETRIESIAKSIAGDDERIDADRINSIHERLKLRLLPAQIQGKDVWQIEVKLVGRGSDFETQLVDRIASDLALAWQQELLGAAQRRQVEFVESKILGDRHLTERLAERVERASALQWDAIQSTLAELGSSRNGQRDTTSQDLNGWSTDESKPAETSNSLPVTSFNGPRIDLEDYHPIREPSDREETKPESGMVENPQWLMLANEKARLEWLIEKLKRQNHWTAAHPEISSLSNDLQLVTREMTRVERFVVDDSALAGAGGSQFEENGYASGGARQRDSLAAESASYQPAANIDTDEIKARLEEPLEELRRDLEGMGSRIDIPQGASRETEPVLSRLPIAKPYLSQPARMRMHTGTRGTAWRIGLIASFAIAFGGGATWMLRRNQDASLSSTREIERELGLPIVGVLGNPNRKQAGLLNSIKPGWVVRSAETMVAVTFGMLIVAVTLDPHLAIDLAENPLLTVSDILGSLLRS